MKLLGRGDLNSLLSHGLDGCGMGMPTRGLYFLCMVVGYGEWFLVWIFYFLYGRYENYPSIVSFGGGLIYVQWASVNFSCTVRSSGW